MKNTIHNYFIMLVMVMVVFDVVRRWLRDGDRRAPAGLRGAGPVRRRPRGRFHGGATSRTRD